MMILIRCTTWKMLRQLILILMKRSLLIHSKALYISLISPSYIDIVKDKNHK
jgi:hypothetical protein